MAGRNISELINGDIERWNRVQKRRRLVHEIRGGETSGLSRPPEHDDIVLAL